MIPIPVAMETERLRLRKIELADADALFTAYTHDPEATKYLRWKTHETVEETKQFLQNALDSWENGEEYNWTIMKKDGNALIGMIRLTLQNGEAIIGYVLKKSEWGQGYTSEAYQKLVDVSFQELGAQRLFGVCDVDNIASARVMQKAGLHSEGVIPKYSIHPNISPEPRDANAFALNAAEYKSKHT